MSIFQMNRGFRPSLAPPLPGEPPLGYLRPISEVDPSTKNSTYTDIHPSPPGTPDSLKGLGFSPPPFATTGQLKYGPILAAAAADGQSPVFSLSALAQNSNEQVGDPLSSTKRNDSVLSAQSFDEDDYLAPSSTTGSDSRYITMDSDHYELPNNDRSSVNYDQIVHDTANKHNPPVLPRKESDGPHRNSAVKVLPTNALALLTKTSDDTESYTPVAKPRRKKRASDVQETSLTENNGSKETNVVNSHSPVTSTKSNNSSHHYFVLEPHLV